MNPLTSLDEIIWQQYEKVNSFAHKKFGYSKYDLAKIAGNVGGGAFMGAGLYMAMQGYYEQEPVLTGLGILFSVFGGAAIPCNNFIYKRREKMELNQIISTGVPNQPKFGPFRPLWLIGGAVCVGLALSDYLSMWKEAKNLIGVSPEQFESLQALTFGALAVNYFGNGSERYFRDTIMRPPSKDKVPMWRRALNYVKSKVSASPELAPQEIPNGKYQTIDEVVL